MSNEERYFVSLSPEQTRQIGKELMRRIQEVAKAHGTNETVAALIHVSGWLAGRSGFGIEHGADITPALELFSDGYVAGFTRMTEEMMQDGHERNN